MWLRIGSWGGVLLIQRQIVVHKCGECLGYLCEWRFMGWGGALVLGSWFCLTDSRFISDTEDITHRNIKTNVIIPKELIL